MATGQPVKPYSGNRDPRFARIHRGGTLDELTHQSLARWAAFCAERVLPLFATHHPADERPEEAVEGVRQWAAGEISMMQARQLAVGAHAAARSAEGAASLTARAAGHAAATAHMADHALGAAFYALKAIAAAYPGESARLDSERLWQTDALTEDIRALVLDDMRLRSKKFQGMF